MVIIEKVLVIVEEVVLREEIPSVFEAINGVTAKAFCKQKYCDS